MKTIRKLHLYLGSVFAPMLIFFAVTGSWQLFALHRGTKDGSYVPPRLLSTLSTIHQYQHLPGTGRSLGTPLRFFILAAAAALVLTTVLGVIMAFRSSRSPVPVLLSLGAGIVFPVVLLLFYH